MNEKEKLLPQLFIPDIVWDSTPLRIVRSMNEAECIAMVGATARKLRKNSACIQHAFSDYPETRFLNAKFITLDSLGEAVESDEASPDGYRLRSKELAAEKLEQIFGIISDYRRDSGYRFLCTLAIAAVEEGHSVETLKAATSLRMLGRIQASHMETLMLIDRLKVLNKSKTAENSSAFGKEQLVLTQLIDCHLAATLQVFNKIEVNIGENSKTPYEQYEQWVDTHAEWTESSLSELRTAESAVRVFRETNKLCTSHLWGITINYMNEKLPQGRVFKNAA